MQTRVLLGIVLLELLACSSTSSAKKSSNGHRESDGLSCETRVAVPGVPAEYAWIRQHYPGAQVEIQALGSCKGVMVDQISVTTAEGRPVTLYFDISRFFGKGLGP
jgi:hypothetical protein